MKYCDECGTNHKVKYVDEYEQDLCNNCIITNREHPINDIPASGEIIYDAEDRPICHICGRAYKKLMSHVRQRHDISALEYKKYFGLSLGKGIISPVTADILRRHVDKNYDVVVTGNLLKNGTKTRFEDGYEGRTKDKLSLQELKSLQKGRKNKDI